MTKKTDKQLSEDLEDGLDALEGALREDDDGAEEPDHDPIPHRPPDKTATGRRYLVIPFGPDELQEVATDMARQLREARDLDATRAAQNSALNGKIKKRMETARELADAYALGGRRGDVETELTYYYDENLVVEVRPDTGEIIETRALNHDERQLALQVIDGGEQQERTYDPDGDDWDQPIDGEEDEDGKVVAFPGDDGRKPTPPSRPRSKG